MDLNFPLFFNTLENKPVRGSDDFYRLIDEEVYKLENGITIDGVHISGWLYWHLNHWHIAIDVKQENKNIIKIESLPYLRDNEWIRAEALEKCRVEQKGYMEIGLRQAGKSELLASYLAYNAVLFKNTQNVLVGGNDPDITLLKAKVDFGLKKLWEGINIPRLDKTWKSNSVRLGYKLTSGEDDIWSTIIIRNAADGSNTETAAGTTAKSYIMDEVGKYSFSKVFEAAKPALNSEFGWRAIPILIGTGGSFDKGADAERFFHHPDANNFLGFVDPETNKKTCLFMSGIYRQDCKTETTLGDYLTEQGRNIPKDSYLFSLSMKVADKERALQKIKKERELKKQDPDQQEYLKVIMYHPLTPDECFLSVSDNIFNTTIAKAQKNFLLSNNITGSCVTLEHDGERIKHTFVDKKPISNFPHTHADNKDAPVQIWEMPVSNAPYGLYTAGVDSYRQANSADSASLGAIYIFKRVHNIHDEKFKNMFVAAYVARPEDKNKWNETVRSLIKFYNARTLVENDESTFIDYMIAKGDEHYLEPEPQYLKGLVANSRVAGRRYGIHRSAAVIMNQLHTTFKSYMEEVIHTERNKETGSVIKETLGISQILDPMLLEEVIKFNPDLNVDRIVAAELALSLGLYLNRSMGVVSTTEEDTRMQSYMNRGNKQSLFKSHSPQFTKQKRLFR